MNTPAPTRPGPMSQWVPSVRASIVARTGRGHQRSPQLRGDTATLGRLLSKSYIQTTHFGTVLTKAERLASLAARVPHYSTVDKSQMVVRVVGDAAVVTGIAHDASVNRVSEFDSWLRFTDVWFEGAGAWRLVAVQKTAAGDTRAAAPAQASDSLRAFIAALDWTRFQAVQRADLSALDTLLADDWLASGSSPTVLTKPEYLNGLRLGTRAYGDIRHEDVRVRIYGDGALVTGRATGPYRIDRRDMNQDARFTHVYTRRNGRWVMVGMHTTVITPH